ncbi:serine/threonine-protein kinase [Prescottella equi]|nr:serine/threonine-protein kinase [Prescottella equi]
MSSKKPKSAKYNPQPTSSKATYIVGGIAVVVIAALVIGGILLTRDSNKPRNEGYGAVQNSAVQVTMGEAGVVRLGLPDVTNTIDVFEDPMCPYCAQLEEKHGQEVAQAIDEGKVAVNYHILNFLNRLSASGDYSTRAVAASQCVAQTGDAIAYSKFTPSCSRRPTSPPRTASPICPTNSSRPSPRTPAPTRRPSTASRAVSACNRPPRTPRRAVRPSPRPVPPAPRPSSTTAR